MRCRNRVQVLSYAQASYWQATQQESRIINLWLLIGASLIYIGILFYIAYTGDRRGRNMPRPGARPVVYALSLGVFCTSWAFYGSVGSAATSGWDYLPLYLGPMIALAVLAPVLRKMLLISKQQNTTSIADFIGARYGKSQRLAALVAVVALLVVLPYIALQLDALTMSFNTVVHGVYSRPDSAVGSSDWLDTGLLIAIAMAIFAIAFGTRHVNPRESHQGVIRAIAFESIVKLGAFLLVGIVITFYMFGGPVELLEVAQQNRVFWHLFNAPVITPSFITLLLLSMMATFCLPRQFHVGVVENTDTRDLNTARWLFPLYMFAMSLFVLPLAIAGITLFSHSVIDPDRLVLALPMYGGMPWLTLVAYIGGMSAATSIVIMAAVTLSTMLSNEVVIPIALRLPGIQFGYRQDLSRMLLYTRRILIIIILILSWLCYRLFTSPHALTDIGLLSLSGIVLFAPPMIGGIYIRHITRSGAASGLLAGLCVWLYTLVFPVLSVQGWLPTDWLSADGPFGISWLSPHALFNTHFSDPLTHGVFWMLAGEILVMTAVSLNTSATLIERIQASAFVDLGMTRMTRRQSDIRPAKIRIGELEVLLQRFLGPQAAHAALNEYAKAHDQELLSNQIVDPPLLQFAEQRLASVVGSASARLMLASGLRQHDLDAEDMVRLLDRTADAVQFNRHIMQAALENIDSGISVIDQDLRLVAWNSRYMELFEYPTGMIHTGRHISDLIRFNAMRGECGPGPVEEHVRKRLEHYRTGKPHRFERHRHNDTVLLMEGNPIPGGGFVMTFNDITVFKRNEAALTRMNQELEARVARRTAELSQANEGLRNENQQRAEAEKVALESRREAERANLSKTRFLAAASHDLLQPLNAARLFAAGAENGREQVQQSAIKNIQASLEAAQALLEPLLDISKIDAGAWDVNPRDFPLPAILVPLIDEFGVLARHAGLTLRAVPSSAWVHSDPNLLRRILQNFLSNAIRYTDEGRILFGTRRRADHVLLEVWDTGPGIEADQISSIFEEFQRGVTSHKSSERGLGLGLSLADRMARLLGHEITVDSIPGRGTVFRIRIERAAQMSQSFDLEDDQRTEASRIRQALCVDDDSASLDALVNLLERWGIDCMTTSPEDARDLLNDEAFDIAIFDHDLGEQKQSGLRLIDTLDRDFPHTRFILVTANRKPEITTAAGSLGIDVVYKPISPDALQIAVYRPLSRGKQPRAT